MLLPDVNWAGTPMYSISFALGGAGIEPVMQTANSSPQQTSPPYGPVLSGGLKIQLQHAISARHCSMHTERMAKFNTQPQHVQTGTHCSTQTWHVAGLQHAISARADFTFSATRKLGTW